MGLPDEERENCPHCGNEMGRASEALTKLAGVQWWCEDCQIAFREAPQTGRAVNIFRGIKMESAFDEVVEFTIATPSGNLVDIRAARGEREANRVTTIGELISWCERTMDKSDAEREAIAKMFGRRKNELEAVDLALVLVGAPLFFAGLVVVALLSIQPPWAYLIYTPGAAIALYGGLGRPIWRSWRFYASKRATTR